MSYTPYNSPADDDNIGESVETLPRPSSRLPRILALAGFVVLLGVLLGIGIAALPGRLSDPTKGLTEEPHIGYLAPDFALVDVRTNQTVTLSMLRGKPVWINFWATWCPPCREEMPEMQQLYEQHKDKGLVILGVDVQEKREDVLHFINEGNFTWPFMIDTGGRLTDRYLIMGMPSHFFVDKNGVIQAIHVGGLQTMSGMKAPIDEYLDKILAP
jgi:thiol-disulfide isomerase/thioredoxin